MIVARRIVSSEGPIDMFGRPMTITVNTWVVGLGGSYRRPSQGAVSQGGIGFAYSHPLRIEVGRDTSARPIYDHVPLVRFVCILAIAAIVLIRRRHL